MESPQLAHTPHDQDYQHWRGLKRRADKMLRDHPIIQRFTSGQPVNKNTYNKHYDVLAAWAELVATIAEFENNHAGELRLWQKQAIAERPLPPKQPRDIRIFGRMMTRAQKLRQELPFRLWAAIRYLDEPGRGSVATAEIRETFSGNGLHTFTSWPNFRKQINRAIYSGYLHYSKDGQRLFYTSEKRVALEVLGLDAVGGWALTFTIEEWTSGNFVSNRARFYAGLHGSRGDGFNRPISRQSINQETGRGKRTQRKYERLAEVQTSRNYEYVEHAEKVEEIPSSYSANTRTVKRGRRWLNLRIKNLCKKYSDNGQHPPVIAMGSCDPQIKQRRYFTKPQAFSADGVRLYTMQGKPWLWQRATV